MLIPPKSCGHLWRLTLIFEICQRRILYRLSAPERSNVTAACRWQMGGLGVWRWPRPLPLCGSARRNVLSPSPPTVLPADNTSPPLPLCPVSSHSSPLWSPLSSLSHSSYASPSSFFFHNLPLSLAGPDLCAGVRVGPVSMETDK